MTTSRSDIDPTLAAHHAPDYDDVMIDIETMSLHPHNSLILSIGMIEFDPKPIEGLKIGARSLILPDIETQLALGREVSASTQKFWIEQTDAAREHWVNPEDGRMCLSDVLYHVRTFCARKGRVWANGTQFDLSNLVGLNAQVSGEPLWHYQAPRDMRTFVKETPATRLVPIGDALDIPGVPHEPIYDCIAQATQVWSHYSADR